MAGRFLFCFRAGLVGLLWLLGGDVFAQGPSVDLPVLDSYQAFWNLPDTERGQEYRMRFEVDILYYDPEWRILWLSNEGIHFFCQGGMNRFPIRPGQRALFECSVRSGGGFEPNEVRFKVLGDVELPAALDAEQYIGRYKELDRQIVRFSGVVESQRDEGPRHLALEVASGAGVAEVIVLKEEGVFAPDYVGKRVVVEGFSSYYSGPDLASDTFVLLVSGLEKVQDLGPLVSDKNFSSPLFVGERLRAQAEGEWVRVEGVVRDFKKGHSVVLWDDSAQIVVHSGRTAEPHLGELLSAYGQVHQDGLQVVLENALWTVVKDERRLAAAGLSTAGLPGELPLRKAVQVLELGLDEAAQGYSVELSGVVTWSDPELGVLFLQDSTHGICVQCGPFLQGDAPRVGDSVWVSGHTDAGSFVPIVRCSKLEKSGASFPMPEPRFIRMEQSLGGSEESMLVEMRGYVHAVRMEGRWTILQLTTPSGFYRARLLESRSREELDAMVGAVVRMRGICLTQPETDRSWGPIELLLSGWPSVDVESAPLSDPFLVGQVNLAEIRKLGPHQTPYRQMRTSGVVTYVVNNWFVLQSGDMGVEVFCHRPVDLKLGDTVEVSGFSGRTGPRSVLREAFVRKIEAAEMPRVARWTGELGSDAGLDNRLVEIDAELEDILKTEQGTLLYFRSGNVWFMGHIQKGLEAGFRRGSLISCTGVYRVEPDFMGQSEAFGVYFRKADDLTVLKYPSAFTLKHAMIAISAISLGGGAALLWVILLRKQVAAQTRMIREQMEHQALLETELQKAAKLESLGLLAGGIAHDFNNLLMVIMGNLSLAMLEEKAVEVAGDCLSDAKQGVERAQDLTQQLLTFARGGEPLKAAEVLPEIVREAAEFVLRGSSVSCDYEFDAHLWPAEVDRGQIGQVVHNLVLNAMQAMPSGGMIRVKAHNEVLEKDSIGDLPAGQYIHMLLGDTGPGISADKLDHLFDPYFTTKKEGHGLGLATVHSIVRRHRGYIRVHSEIGHGTVFNIWLPAAKGAVAEQVETVVQKPKLFSGRVLVMDDEGSIRRILVSLLRHMGLRATAVADGAAAIDAYEQAQAEGTPFVLTIMDLTVPGGMGGREALEELLRIDPAVKAIVSSGYSSDPVLANYRDYGFVGQVVKPYDVEKLMDCIGLVLGG